MESKYIGKRITCREIASFWLGRLYRANGSNYMISREDASVPASTIRN